LSAAGVGRIWSTDTVAHSTNAISIVPLLAAALAAQPRQTPKDTPAAL
jgi:ribose-phosphate pyrophosphokinase